MELKKKKHDYDDTVIIYEGAQVHESVEIGPFTIVYPNVEIEKGTKIMSSVILGKSPHVGKTQVKLTKLKERTTVKENSFIGDQAIIYSGVEVGRNNYIADKALLRENVILDDDVVIGTAVVVSFNARIGKKSKIMTMSNIAGNMIIGDNVFVGVHVCSVTDNNPNQMSKREDQKGPQIADSVFIGSNVTLLPGVEINEGITVGGGAVVTKNLEKPNSIYFGNPAAFYKSKD